MKSAETKSSASRQSAFSPYLILTAALVLGFLLRLPPINGQTTYLHQEIQRDLAVTVAMDHGVLPYEGPVSVYGNLHFGAAYYYILYPFPKLLGFRESSLSFASLFFSLATALLAFFTVRRWTGSPRTAVLCAAMMCVSTLDVIFSKYASNPNFLPFFALLFFSSVERFLAGRGHPLYALMAGFSFGIVVQLHTVAAISLPIVLLFLLVSRPKGFRLRHAAIFTVAAAAVILPFVLMDPYHGLGNAAGLATIALRAPNYGNIFSRLRDIASFWITLVVSLNTMWNLILEFGWPLLAAIYANILLVAVLWFHERRWRAVPDPTRAPLPPAARLTLVAWILPATVVLTMPVGAVAIVPLYYFTMLIPAGYVVFALGLVALENRGFRRTARVLLLSYLCWQALQLLAYHLQYPTILTAWLTK